MMKYEDLDMPYNEIEAFYKAHDLELESQIHQSFNNEEMLLYIKNNENVVCRPVYYFGDTISAIRIDEIIDGKKIVSYWNVK